MSAVPATRMFQEAAESPARVRAQLASNHERVTRLARSLRASPPRAVVTCARGSSDHAATFAKYLIETRLGVLTASAAPSISSVYEAKPALADTLFLAISQSGASPDLLAATDAARLAGARVVAMVNAEDSPLARLAHEVLPLAAGRETSVAATKSFVASLAAVIHLVAEWAGDDQLTAALGRAPDHLEDAWALDWSPVQLRLQATASAYVVGRGLGLAIAQEAALKLKETCGLHAEAISAAEVRHGPMALIARGFPVLAFSQNDETRAGVEALAADLATRGAAVMLAGPSRSGVLHLPVIEAHAVIEPMLMIQSFYRMVVALALARNRDPDAPPHLQKVTATL